MSTTTPPSRKTRSRKVAGREIFRTRTPIIVWWVWLAFAVINALDLAIQWHHRSAVVYGAILALATGVAYACALRPRLVADDSGVTVVNPLRDCTIPWSSIRAVDVGEAVQVHYSLADGTAKVFPSWALYSSSRAQLKHDQRARKRAVQLSKQSPMYNQLPDEAKDTMARSEAQLIAWQLDERAQRARTAGAAPGQPAVAWAWLPVAAIAGPAIALVALLIT